jgi:hypothetical protein
MNNKEKDWKCGNCGKTYSFNEFIGLTNIGVCDCGYRFSLDRWRLHDQLKIKIDGKEVWLLISTAFLEINHRYFGKDLWYETMIFAKEDGIDCSYEERYETKEEAISDHNRIIDNLNNGEYTIKRDDSNIEIIIH